MHGDGDNGVALVKYEAARRALAECVRLDESKNIRDKAQALAAYARQARDTEMIAWATEIKVRAERRCGELLREQARIGERAKKGRQSADNKSRTLRDLGITEDHSSRWQTIAALPEPEFEAGIADAKAAAGAVTTAHLLRLAKAVKARADKRAAIDGLFAETPTPRLRHPNVWPRLFAAIAGVVAVVSEPGEVPPPPLARSEETKDQLRVITEFCSTHFGW